MRKPSTSTENTSHDGNGSMAGGFTATSQAISSTILKLVQVRSPPPPPPPNSSNTILSPPPIPIPIQRKSTRNSIRSLLNPSSPPYNASLFTKKSSSSAAATAAAPNPTNQTATTATAITTITSPNISLPSMVTRRNAHLLKLSGSGGDPFHNLSSSSSSTHNRNNLHHPNANETFQQLNHNQSHPSSFFPLQQQSQQQQEEKLSFSNGNGNVGASSSSSSSFKSIPIPSTSSSSSSSQRPPSGAGSTPAPQATSSIITRRPGLRSSNRAMEVLAQVSSMLKMEQEVDKEDEGPHKESKNTSSSRSKRQIIGTSSSSASSSSSSNSNIPVQNQAPLAPAYATRRATAFSSYTYPQPPQQNHQPSSFAADLQLPLVGPSTYTNPTSTSSSSSYNNNFQPNSNPNSLDLPPYLHEDSFISSHAFYDHETSTCLGNGEGRLSNASSNGGGLKSGSGTGASTPIFEVASFDYLEYQFHQQNDFKEFDVDRTELGRGSRKRKANNAGGATSDHGHHQQGGLATASIRRGAQSQASSSRAAVENFDDTATIAALLLGTKAAFESRSTSPALSTSLAKKGVDDEGKICIQCQTTQALRWVRYVPPGIAKLPTNAPSSAAKSTANASQSSAADLPFVSARLFLSSSGLKKESLRLKNRNSSSGKGGKKNKNGSVVLESDIDEESEDDDEEGTGSQALGSKGRDFYCYNCYQKQNRSGGNFVTILPDGTQVPRVCCRPGCGATSSSRWHKAHSEGVIITNGGSGRMSNTGEYKCNACYRRERKSETSKGKGNSKKIKIESPK